jgi:hypothetical protein
MPMLVKRQSDIVLRELQAELRKSGVEVSSIHLWRVLKRLGLRLKKVAPRRRARHGGQAARREAFLDQAVHGGHWKTLTILGAMDHTGMTAAMTIEAATDCEVFLAYLDQVLAPKQRPGLVVVMDNLSVHKVNGVRQRIERAGHRCSTCRPTHRPQFYRKALGQAQTRSMHRTGPHG